MNFTISKDFMLDGKPIKLISGALHYFRICPLYWQDRLEKLKNMGCNCGKKRATAQPKKIVKQPQAKQSINQRGALRRVIRRSAN